MELSNYWSVKSPEPEIEAPNPTRIKLPLKRHAPPVVTYGKCLKNHAAGIGGHAVDGCGEFMPSPDSNPGDPTSIRCAACGCHRSFHRRGDGGQRGLTHCQAEKMVEVAAERVGWKMQMKDEELLNIFL